VGDGSVKAVVGYQQNRRQEFEDGDEPGLDFRLHTVNYDLHYQSPAIGHLTYAAGLSGMWQHSENLGDEFLIPSYKLFDIGAFASATYSLDRLTLSGGLRYDNRHLHSYALEDDGELRFKDFSRNFNGVTGSIGAIYNLSDRINLRLNLSRGFRAPNLSELGSNGEHEGTFRYEIGNSDLSPEFSWQGDLGIDYSSEIFSAQLSFFANHISDFIFLERIVDDQYQFTQGDARLWGGEASVDFHPIEPLHFENSFSYVNAGTNSFGYLLSQSLNYNYKKLSIQAMFNYFHTDDYSMRIYLYERDMQYACSFPTFFGHGIHYALWGRYNLSSSLRVTAKLGVTSYFDRSHISENEQKIDSSSKSDLDLQVSWRF
jgi:outer membrane receptor protein involved in Fe transport